MNHDTEADEEILEELSTEYSKNFTILLPLVVSYTQEYVNDAIERTAKQAFADGYKKALEYGI